MFLELGLVVRTGVYIKFVGFIETESHHVAWDGLELSMLLSQPSVEN